MPKHMWRGMQMHMLRHMLRHMLSLLCKCKIVHQQLCFRHVRQVESEGHFVNGASELAKHGNAHWMEQFACLVVLCTGLLNLGQLAGYGIASYQVVFAS